MSAPQQSAAELQARADEALAQFRTGAREIKRHGDEARRAIAEATGEATSADGSVTVDVSFDGAVRSLRFGPAITSLTPDRLAQQVMSTIRVATAQAVTSARSGVVAALGPDNEAVTVLDRRLAETGAMPAADAVPDAVPGAGAEGAPAAAPSDAWQGRG